MQGIAESYLKEKGGSIFGRGEDTANGEKVQVYVQGD